MLFKSSKLTFILALLLLITACGQTGPLFMPDADNKNQQQEQTEEDELEKDSGT